VPHDLVLKAMNGIHRAVLAVSGGRLGWQAGSMPVLELTTIGRTSGQRRSVMLTSPVQEGQSLVVVASRGGDDRHPAWFLNLQANPDVEVTTKVEGTRPMRARVATEAERRWLWPLVTAKAHNYASYQLKTDREIPLVLLEPTS
jgi:deazaflavin-dependent oxidoreductase (nitroreductase family)